YPHHSYALPPPPTLYTLSLHDALPISRALAQAAGARGNPRGLRAVGARFGLRSRLDARASGTDGRRLGAERLEGVGDQRRHRGPDRKSTRLNSSHVKISYAVFCLKKKK